MQQFAAAASVQTSASFHYSPASRRARSQQKSVMLLQIVTRVSGLLSVSVLALMKRLHSETQTGLTHEETSDHFTRKEEVSSDGGRQMMRHLKQESETKRRWKKMQKKSCFRRNKWEGVVNS